jgi:hypothetical protein
MISLQWVYATNRTEFYLEQEVLGFAAGYNGLKTYSDTDSGKVWLLEEVI